jgi:CheY-like chemotaxis protein
MNIPSGVILVVEDVPNVLELLEVTLRFKGYPVVTARNGEEALQVLEKVQPALVITDILMPKLDGYAFVYKMRINPKTRAIPVMFLSATYVTPEDKNFAMNLGASRFVEKPIDTEEFLLTVAELLMQGPPTIPEPLATREFYQGYRERLENKLRHKNTQIARTERLLSTLPDDQKPAFEAMLNQAHSDRENIQAELNDIYRSLDELKQK